MNLPAVVSDASKAFKVYSPQIMTAIGAAGVVSTAYLTGKASFEATRVLEGEDPEMPVKEKVKYVWKLYIPAGLSGAFAIGCIIGASKASTRRTAAAVGAYSLTERAFSEYREKVIDQLGEKKEDKIQDEIRQEQVLRNPGKEVVILGTGNVLCCELYTHRYFRSDMETLRRAENQLNKLIVNDLYVTLDEFYDILGLPGTSVSQSVGWNSDRLMELQFSTVISEDGEPCLAFDYNYVKPIKV